LKFGTLTTLTAASLFGVLPIPVRPAAQHASSEIITFDAPGASSVAGSFDGTFPESINDTGAITGHYVDAHNVNHGFLRSPGGEFITFDAPGANSTTGSFDGTFPTSINNGGTITGSYIDSKELTHGFLRSPGGEFITFDTPGASSVAAAGYGTFPKRINDAGAITGHYTDAHNVIRGFVRSPSGEFTTFDAPGASSVAAFGYGTFPESINDTGTITGHYSDAHGMSHGFLRSPSGEITTFDPSGAGSVAASGYGTFAESINDAGAVTGQYTDANGLIHGFLRIP